MLGRVLTGIVAAGVVLAGIVLWQFRPIRRARWIVAAVTTYGVIAFVEAMITGVTLRAALSGHELFQSLPYVLQGAVIGCFVVLPLGWIASIVRAGVPRFREGSPQSNLYQAIALTTCLAVVATSFQYDRSTKPKFTRRDPQARPAALERSLHAIEDGERDSPRDRWDPEYVVSMVGRDPQHLFAWVHDNTLWIPYRGELRGPVGVLMDRRGNSLDRALLLATLLEKAGQTVRLAHGELKPEQARQMLTGFVTRQTPVSALPAESGAADRALPQVDIKGATAKYQLDSAAVWQTLEAQRKEIARVQTELAARVADQTARLLRTVVRRDRAQDWNKRLEAATAALRDHWWVQRQDGPVWVDLDLLGRDGVLVAAAQTMPVSAVPAELHHEVNIKVITEQWAGGTRKEDTVLQHALRPAETFGEPAVLQFWPGSWPSDIQADPNGQFGFKANALAQKQWAVFLKIGHESVAQAVIGDNGATNDTAATNPFAALGGAVARDLGQQDTRELTAAWIDYEIRVPGEAPRAIRRVVFDLLGPARRASGSAPQLPFSDSQKLTRSLALMMQTEILPVGCRIAPEFVTHIAAHALINNRALLGGIVSENFSPEVETAQQRLANAEPAVSPLVLLSVARLEWSSVADQVVVDRPNILTRHRSLVAVDRDIAAQDAVDIGANEIGVDLTEQDAFPIRLEQGVFDTNAEAILAGPAKGNTAEAYAASHDWLTFDAGQHSGLSTSRFPDDYRRQVDADLDSGYTVVVPQSAPQRASEISTGWWRIDPRSGDTLGVSSNGWGGAGVEGASLITMAVNAVAGFAFEYALCQGISQGINGVRLLNERYFGGWHPSWTTGVKSQDPATLFKENNRVCLIQAIIGGFVATLPLLMITMRARQARMAAELAERVAAKEAAAEALEKEVANLDRLLDLPHVDGPATKTIVDASKSQELSKTAIPKAKSVLRNDPAALLEKERLIQAAEADMHRLQQELNKTMRDLLEYGKGKPAGLTPSPTYDPMVEEALQARAAQEFQEYSKSVDELMRLDPLAGGHGTGGGGPNLAPPPQPIGNNNLTSPQQQVVVGSASASNALGGGTP